MSSIINISNYLNTYAPAQQSNWSESSRSARTAPGSGDQLELSPAAETLARATGESSLRLAHVAAIRAELAAGTFETPERINGTVDRLIDVLA